MMGDIWYLGYRLGYHPQWYPLDILFYMWQNIWGGYPSGVNKIQQANMITLEKDYMSFFPIFFFSYE